MKKTPNSAEILDFQTYKQQQEQPQPMWQQHAPVAPPGFAWYPVWVLVPQFPHA